MSDVAERLRAAGLALPEPAAALGDYVGAVRVGNLVFTSGQLPMLDGALMARGHVPSAVSADEARECAAQAALNALAAADRVCDLDQVDCVVKVVGYVASADGFEDQPAIINAASAVMVAAFGEAGRHAREAVGVAELPLGAPVELSVIIALAD